MPEARHSDEWLARVDAWIRSENGPTFAEAARQYGMTKAALHSAVCRWRRRLRARGESPPDAAPQLSAPPHQGPAAKLVSPGPAPQSDADRMRAMLDGLRRELDLVRRRWSDEKRRRWDAEEQVREAEKRARVAEELADAPLVLPPIIPKGKQSKARNRGIPVVTLSDWHVEEVVDPATVNNRNRFNPAIAEERAGYLFEGIVWQFQQWAKSWDINEAVVWLGGDFISGYIHEELLESNSMSPTEGVLFAQELLSRGLIYLLEGCPFLERITLPCNWGNHGRTTQKRRISTAAKNSYEWLMYRSLEQRFEDRERLIFHVADGAHLYSEVYGERFRWTHGDDVRYWGGVGGLTIPLQKACDAWDEFEPVRRTVLGHYHQARDFEYALVNGSLIGFNPFALSIKARYEPPRQLAFLIDEEWGKKATAKIYCDPVRKAA